MNGMSLRLLNSPTHYLNDKFFSIHQIENKASSFKSLYDI